MTSRTLLVLALIVLVLGTGYTQQPIPSGIPVTPTLPSSPMLPVVGLPTPQLPTPTIPATQPVKEKSLDQLLDELEALRAKKAQLEKSEQELMKAIQQKAGQQAERIKRLCSVPAPTDKLPNRVGSIKIEGNTVTTEGKILGLLSLQPGIVFENSDLEEARTRLKRAGFQSVTVEVMANDRDSNFMDIVVKVKEKEK